VPDGAPVHYERHRPEQTTLNRLVQHVATFFAEVEAASGGSLPSLIKDEFDAFLECGILAHGFLRLRCGDCGRAKFGLSAASAAGSARRGRAARDRRERDAHHHQRQHPFTDTDDRRTCGAVAGRRGVALNERTTWRSVSTA